MKLVLLVAALESLAIASAEQLRSESHADIPRVQLFQRKEGIKLGKETIKSDKFLEQKILPVEPWNPPNKDVEELYFKQKAMRDFNEGLSEDRGFTDTDIIMLNRWRGLEDQHDLWESDMILSPKQRAMYTKQGKLFDIADHLMFSQPWPEGEVGYFFENEGSEDLFGDLKMAMIVWEHVIGCVKFKLTDVATISQTTSKKPAPANLGYEDLTTTSVSPEGVGGILSNSSSSSGSGSGSSNSSSSGGNSTSNELSSVDFTGTSHLLRITAGDGCYASVGWRPWSHLVISEKVLPRGARPPAGPRARPAA